VPKITGVIKLKIFITMKNRLPIKFIFVLAMLAFFVCSNYALATAVDNAISGLETSAKKGYTNSAELPAINDIPSTIGTIVGVGLSFIGVLFLVLLIYGGFTWMMARGNQQDVTKAIDLIQAAIIGLIIVLSAYAITAYVGNILT
jgi:hypothetical protein